MNYYKASFSAVKLHVPIGTEYTDYVIIVEAENITQAIPQAMKQLISSLSLIFSKFGRITVSQTESKFLLKCHKQLEIHCELVKIELSE